MHDIWLVDSYGIRKRAIINWQKFLSETQENSIEEGNLSNILTARTALLDFFADRATAFASFFVASIFGLVTLSAVVQGIEHHNPLGYSILIVLSSFAYVGFAYAGYYTFRRFMGAVKI